MSVIRLGDVAEINPRVTAEIKGRADEEIAFVPMDAVGEDGGLKYQERRPVSSVLTGYTLFKRDDVILAKITPCMENGKAAHLGELTTEYGAGSTEFHVLRPGPRLNGRFLFYLIWNPAFRAKAEGRMTGSAGQKRVPADFLRDMEIPLPPLKDQARIAAILDKADAIRRKRHQALYLAGQLLRSVFLDMFGDPVLNPNGWPTKRLDQVADVLVGNPFQSTLYVDEGVRLCRGANVLPTRLNWDDVKFWSSDDRSTYSKYELAENDVILALDRPWISSGIKVAQVRKEDLPALLVQRVARIRGKSAAWNAFIYFMLCQKAFERHCCPTETTVPHISPVELREFPVIVPSDRAITKFGQLVERQASVFSQNETSSQAASDLFASLSQRAFRGDL